MASALIKGIFAVARTAGWIAHAMEEYATNAPLRPRAVYTGLPPDAAKVPAPRAGMTAARRELHQ